MVIQQSINQGLSLLSMLTALGPGSEIAKEKIRNKAEVNLSKKKIDILKERHKEAFEKGQWNALSPLAESRIEEQKKLYELEPTPELAEEIKVGEADYKRRETRSQSDKAKRAAEKVRIEEANRLRADRQREARLKILEGVPLSDESKAYVQERDEINKGGKPVSYGKQ